jgi:hypothetical protein
VNAENIPRTIYINGSEERRLDQVRDRMRRNQFTHQEFNAFYGSKRG